MRRRLFAFCSALSLLLCVIVGVLWVRSYFVLDSLSRTRWTLIPLTPEDRDWNAASQLSGREFTYSLETFVGIIAILHRDDTNGYSWQQVKSTELRPLANGDILYGCSSSPIKNESMTCAWSHFGFRWERIDQSATNFIHLWSVPLYVPMVASAILPLIWFRNRARIRRLARIGCCATCGYDLRASPTRCPECGSTTPRGDR